MKTQGTKLSTYVNNMFATCEDMETALTQAANIAGGADNAAAVHTAVHMVLNTAIKLHQADMAKANAPLLELIESEIQKSFTVVQNSIEHALDAFDRKVDEKIESAIEDLDIEGQIENAIDNIDLETQVQDYMSSNPIDVQDLLSGANVSITFD